MPPKTPNNTLLEPKTHPVAIGHSPWRRRHFDTRRGQPAARRFSCQGLKPGGPDSPPKPGHPRPAGHSPWRGAAGNSFKDVASRREFSDFRKVSGNFRKFLGISMGNHRFSPYFTKNHILSFTTQEVPAGQTGGIFGLAAAPRIPNMTTVCTEVVIGSRH